MHSHELLEEFIPILLNKIQWKKSMYWGTFDLNWGRPLKSILAVFDKKKLNFNFHHLTNPSSAASGDLIFGPLISSDFRTTFF